MPDFDQKNRLLQVKLPFTKPELFLRSFRGREECSRLFRFQLEMVDPDFENSGDISSVLDPGKLLGQLVQFSVKLGDEERHFSGYAWRFGGGSSTTRMAAYTVELVPWAWAMTLNTQSRIFQDMSAKDVIEAVINEAPISVRDFRWETSQPFSSREYCVQYRESDFDFVQRLLEEEGCGYHWEFEEGKHTLVFSQETKTGDEEYAFDDESGALNLITSFEQSFQLHTSKWETKAWLPLKNETVTAKEKSITKFLGNFAGKTEVYEHDFGRVTESSCKTDHKQVNVARLQQAESRSVTFHGTSTAPGVSPQAQFKVSGISHFEGKNYQPLWVDHHGEDSQFFSGSGGTQAYENAFECILAGVKRPPARITRKARIDGIQTAIVVGPKGDEIFTDEHGRVKVSFHWDRGSKSDENSSCWIRVAQVWAGNKFGVYFHPRIGQEVIVSFLDGDPDRPLITGRVYNKANPFPYALPDEKEKSGVKTKSTVKGAASNFNELRFNDKKDKEEIYLHAERDWNTVVENNATLKIGFDTKDKGNHTIDVYNDRKITVEKGHQTVTIKTGNWENKVSKGDYTLLVDKGDCTVKVKTGKVYIEAKKSIELKCGQSSIKLEPTKITMKVAQTKMVFDPTKAALKALNVDVAGTAMTKIKAPMTDIKGDAMLKMKGGVVMIN